MKSTTYTPEFRAEAVKLVLARGLTLDEGAQRLSVPKGIQWPATKIGFSSRNPLNG